MYLFRKFLNSAGVVLPLIIATGCATTKKNAKEEETDNRVFMSKDPRSSLKITGKKSDMPPLPKISGKGNSVLSIPEQINICRLHVMRGDYAGARKIIEDVLEADFRNRDAKILYANILFAKGSIENARVLLEQLGGINAKESEALNLLALIAIRDRAYKTINSVSYSILAGNVNQSSLAAND